MLRLFHSRWLAVAIWVLVIYTSIPLVRGLREFFVARWSPELIGYAVILTVMAAIAGAFIGARRRHQRLNGADIAWLLAVGAVLVLWTFRLMGQPEEAIHFLEYGLLGFLLHRALSPRIPNTSVYFSAGLIGILVGTVDELIQWTVPGRYWDFRDIALNSGACALVLIAVWRLSPPSREQVDTRSLRLFFRLAAAVILLFTLCLSATPKRIDHIAPHLPGLANAAGTIDAICEYGYRYSLDPNTVFRSRMTLTDLQREDSTRAEIVADLLDRSRGSYDEFLREVSPVADPFLYEARVHLFARDRNLWRARKATPGSATHQEHMTVAFRENLVLEEVFAETLNRSSFRWRKALRQKVAEAQDPEAPFVSDVARHLITSISERRLRTLLLAALAVMLVCDLILSRSATRPRREPSPR